MGTQNFDYQSSIVQDQHRICDTSFASCDAGNFNSTANSSLINESPAKIKFNSSMNYIEDNSLSNYYSDEAHSSLDTSKINQNKDSIVKKKFSVIRSFFRNSASLLGSNVVKLSCDSSVEDLSNVTESNITESSLSNITSVDETFLSCADDQVGTFVNENS